MVAVGGLYLLITSSTVLFAVQGQECPRPQDGPPNTNLVAADILKPTFPNGDRAKWECQTGYRPTGGDPRQTCTDGAWSPAIVTLQCERKTCATLHTPENGEIEYPDGGNQFGDTAELVCKTGYHMVGGSKTRRCGADGEWDGRFGACEAETCAKPGDILNGRIEPVKDTYVYEDVVRFRCNKDYTLDGPDLIVCGADGQFSPAPPKCIKVECETPDVPHLERYEGPPPPYTYRHHVKFRCKNGFHLNGSASVTCEINGWSPPLPECKAPPTTPAPPTTTKTTDDVKPGEVTPKPPVPPPNPSPPPPTPTWLIVLVVIIIVIIIGIIIVIVYKRYKKKRTKHITPDTGLY